uniref:BTB domain-containing protein n=1 Tax=Panagrolaimus davidi TaxID=227884 RepID=A0A914QCT1_9BILA
MAASLKILSCLYTGEYLKTIVEIRIPKIRETPFWSDPKAEILTEEKIVMPPAASQSIKYLYKLKWDRQTIEVVKNSNGSCIKTFRVYEIDDDFVFKYEDIQRANVRKSETRTSLLDDLRNANNFTIICKSKTFTINKAILQARSPVFAAMLESNFREAEENLVEITDNEPEIVEKMIEFCETDEIEITEGFEYELYQIAHKYQIDSFIKYTRDLLKSTLTFENTAERLKLAMICSDETLKAFLCSWIRPNFQYICKPQYIFTFFTETEILNIFRDE